MKNILRSLPILFLLSTITIMSSCEDDIVADPSVFLETAIELTGGQQVPAIATKGNGTLDARYDRNSKSLTLTFAWGNLSDSITSLRIHGPAKMGEVGPVILPFTNFNKGKYGTHIQTFKVDEVLLKEMELLNNQYYINILTKSNPLGEIRGQIMFQ